MGPVMNNRSDLGTVSVPVTLSRHAIRSMCQFWHREPWMVAFAHHDGSYRTALGPMLLFTDRHYRP
jgi:hypothetical protein